MKNFISEKRKKSQGYIQKILTIGFLALGSHVCSDQVTLFLIRHGETDWNVQNRCQGHTNIPLNEQGKKQAKEVALKLKEQHPDLAAIYSSDLIRAYDTGLETAKLLGLQIQTSKDLREINFGSAEGMLCSDRDALCEELMKELREKYPNKRDYWQHTAVPGAETLAQVMNRMRAEITKIAHKHPCQKVAIFSHGRALRCFIADIKDREVDGMFLPNCSVVTAIYDTETGSFEIEI